MRDQGFHGAETCREPAHHGRWSVLKHVGDYGSPHGDIAATGERIVVRECRAERGDDWAMIATGFETSAAALAFAKDGAS